MKKYLIKLQTNLAKYSIQLQTNLTAPSSDSNTIVGLTNIQKQMNKTKQFASQSINEVHKTAEQEVTTIKESVGSIFLEQNSVYKDRMKAIKDTCTNALTKQNQLLHKGIEEFMNKIMSYLNSLNKKLSASTTA